MESCDDENQITEGNFKLYLKEEHEGGVEGGESREETHCGAPEAEFVQIRPTVTLNSRKGKQFNVLNACLSAYPALRQTCCSDPTTLQRARPQRPEDLHCNRINRLPEVST